MGLDSAASMWSSARAARDGRTRTDPNATAVSMSPWPVARAGVQSKYGIPLTVPQSYRFAHRRRGFHRLPGATAQHRAALDTDDRIAGHPEVVPDERNAAA
jgi:hypothetical protein